MKKKFLVVGLGRFGLAIAKSLEQMNNDVLAIDIQDDRCERALEYIHFCEVCDASKKDALEELDAASFDTAIVSVGKLEDTFLAVANLSELGVKRIYVRLETDEYINIVKKLGATEVIIPEEAAARSLAHEVSIDNIIDYYEITKDYGIVQVKVSSKFKSTTLVDLNLRNKFDVNIVGILRDEVFFIPKGTDCVEANDVMLVVGKQEKIVRLQNKLNPIE